MMRKPTSAWCGYLPRSRAALPGEAKGPWVARPILTSSTEGHCRRRRLVVMLLLPPSAPPTDAGLLRSRRRRSRSAMSSKTMYGTRDGGVAACTVGVGTCVGVEACQTGQTCTHDMWTE